MTGRLPGLGAEAKETPAVYSDALDFRFTHGVSGDDVGGWLVGVVTRLAREFRARGWFVGHIKLYAESGQGDAWWVASTGAEVSSEFNGPGPSSVVRGCTVAITVILFGADAGRVRASVLGLLHDRCPGHLAL